MRIEVSVSTGRVGSKVTRQIDVPDEATDQEISEEVWEYLMGGNIIEVDWFRA